VSDQPAGTAAIASNTAAQSLRFCMVTSFYPPHNFGGDGIFVQQLAMALARRGHRVTVVHCIDAFHISGGTTPGEPALTHDNLEVIPLRSSAGALSPLITHQVSRPGLKAAELRRILAPGRFDVIHFHNISLIGGAEILSYGDGLKLLTTHEYWLLCPLSTLWKYDSVPCDRRECIRCTLAARRPPQLWRYSGIIQRSLGAVDAILSPSRFVVQRHRAWGIDATFTLMPNFTPDDQVHEAAPRSPEARARPYFLMAGRMEKNKGFQDIIRAFKEFDRADLVIVGSGSYEAELRSLAAGYDHIELVGRIPYAKLMSLYRDARAVIVPSLWYEPFGLIVVEAFARKTPVIVRDSGALPELVEESGGGLVFGDEGQLLQAVERLLQEPDYRDTLGQRGYQGYLRHWSEDSHMARYLGLIADLRAVR